MSAKKLKINMDLSELKHANKSRKWFQRRKIFVFRKATVMSQIK